MERRFRAIGGRKQQPFGAGIGERSGRQRMSISVLSAPTFASLTDNGNGSGSITFSPGAEDAGNYTVELIVTDNGSPALRDTVAFSLTVNNVNRAPIWNGVSAQSMDENSSLSVPVSASDPDGNGISLSALSIPAFASLTDNGNGGGAIAFTTGFEDAGNYTIELIATDNGTPNLRDTLSFALTVNNVNRAPVFAATAAQSVDENSSLSVPVSASDPDGNGIAFSALSLPAFASLSDNGNGSASVQISPGFEDAGNYTLSLIATDNGSPNLSDTLSFALTVGNVNRAPVFAATVAQSMNENSNLSVSVSASDPDGNGMSFAGLNLPAFAALTDNGDGTGSIAFTTGYEDAGSYTIRAIVTDNGTPNLSDTLSFSLTVNNVNRAPIFAAIANQTISENSGLTLPVSATDPDGNGMTIFGQTVPAFGTFSDNGNGTASLQFAPGFEDAGSYPVVLLVLDNGTPALSDTLNFTLTVTNLNRTPVLTAITNQSMEEGAVLNVPVSATDPDGNAISLSAQGIPTFGSFSDNGGGTGSLQFSPGFGSAGNFNIKIFATDNGSPALTDTVSFTLSVGNVNRAPEIAAIANSAVNEGGSLAIPVSATDPDDDGLTLSAIGLPAFASFTDNGSGSGSFQFNPDFSHAGVYNLKLAAVDNGVPTLSDTASFTITVNNINRAPVLAAVANQGVNEGGNLAVPVSASDPDGDALVLTAPNLPTFGTFTDNGDGTGNIEFTPGFGDEGNYTIQLVSIDNGTPVLSDTISFTLVVGNVNRAPVLTAIANRSMNENGALSVAVSASDPDGNGIALSAQNVPAFGSFTDNGDGTGNFQFTTDFTNAGSYSIQIFAVDNGVPALSDTTGFVLTVNDVNRAPQLVAIANQAMDEGASLSVPVSASDPDDDGLTLSALNIPAFSQFTDNGNGTGNIQLTPGFETAGNYTLSIRVLDNGTPALSDTVTFSLSISNVNRAPVVTAIANRQVDEGASLSVPVSASDPDGNAMTLSVLNLPDFGSFTDNGNGTGSFEFSPEFGSSGNYSIKVVALDNGTPALSDTAGFVLTVGNVNRAPEFTEITDQSMPEGNILNLPVTATDPDGDGVILSAANLPAFATFTDNGGGTGNLRIAPDFNASGSYPIRLIARDTGIPQLSDTLNFVLTVTNTNRAPEISAIANQTIREGLVLNVPVSAVDPDGNLVVLSAQNVPAFGTFTDNGGGSGNFRFTPGFGDGGSFTISAIARDTGTPQLTDTLSFVLTVVDTNRAPVIVAIANRTMNESDSLIFDISASDPDGDSLAFSVDGLPAFGTLSDSGDGTGSLHFLPGFSDAGVFSIDVKVTDNGSPAVTTVENFVLTVQNVNRSPVLSAIPDTSLSEGDTLLLAVTASDPDGDPISFTTANLPVFTEFMNISNGSATLKVAPGFRDSGSYPGIEITASDTGVAAINVSVFFQIDVADSNSVPVATDDNFITKEDSSATFLPLANDADANGDTLRIVAILSPTTGGTITVLSGDTAVFFEPAANFDGTFGFNYVIGDGQGVTDTAAVSIAVTPVNDAPLLTGLPDSIVFNGDMLDTLRIWDAISDVDDSLSAMNITWQAFPDTLAFSWLADSGWLQVGAKQTNASVTAELVVTVSDAAGASVSDTIGVRIIGVMGIGDDDGNMPQQFVVYQNYPNPFNPQTTIRFGIPVAEKVKISVYNILGQQVAVLLNEQMPAGYHTVQFDARQIASGMYFYLVQTEKNRSVHKMMLIK
ncbi:MAG: tandem-95 repeat protein [Calditrichae bacterium]|nr:tandem-95 repeat protein [Calditrichia bacterium]